jgi:hypothetical protein
MLSEETADLDEVAKALGRSPAWLRRNWSKIAREEGFPRKLPCGPVWPRRPVVAWLRAGGVITAMAEPTNDNTAGGDVIASYKEQLALHYGGGMA